MHSRLGNDAKRLKRIPRGVFAFLRDHHWTALFQTGDLPVDMQHLGFKKRRAITSNNRACVWRCTQRARLDAQRSASKSITLEKSRRHRIFHNAKGYVILSEAKLQRSGQSPRGDAFHLWLFKIYAA